MILRGQPAALERIQCGTTNTYDLCVELMRVVSDGRAAQILAPVGEGKPLAQRIRVMLSRARQKKLKRGGTVKQFTLRTHMSGWDYLDGRRYDSIIFWVERSRTQVMCESILEGLLR